MYYCWFMIDWGFGGHGRAIIIVCVFFWGAEEEAAMAEAPNGEFSFATSNVAKGRNGLPKIQTAKKKEDEICHDDSVPPVKAQTVDELHSLQKKKSAPTTPIKSPHATFSATISEEERQIQQLQSIR